MTGHDTTATPVRPRITRRAFVTLVGGGAALLATSCSGATGSGQDAQEVQPATLASSGWFVEPDQRYFDSTGVVHYALALTNPNAHVELSYPSVHIRGLAEDGSELFSQQDHIAFLRPNETGYISGSAGRGITQQPADVEITVDSDGYGYITAATDEGQDRGIASLFGGTAEEPSVTPTENIYQFGEIEHTVSDDYGERHFLDTTITANETWDDMPYTRVCLVLRDGEGTLLGGYEGPVASLQKGQETAYQLIIETTMPEYGSWEFHAVPTTDANNTINASQLVAH